MPTTASLAKLRQSSHSPTLIITFPPSPTASASPRLEACLPIIFAQAVRMNGPLTPNGFRARVGAQTDAVQRGEFL